MDYVILCVSLQSKYDVHPKEEVRLWGSPSCCRICKVIRCFHLFRNFHQPLRKVDYEDIQENWLNGE